MYYFGASSKERLAECTVEIQTVLNLAIEVTDFSVVCGHRNQVDQNVAYERGFSRLVWPNSDHNAFPSPAVDVVPWSDKYGALWGGDEQLYKIARDKGTTRLEAKRWVWQRYAFLFGVISGIAKVRCPDVRLVWGNDWDGDQDYLDQSLVDMPHVGFKRKGE